MSDQLPHDEILYGPFPCPICGEDMLDFRRSWEEGTPKQPGSPFGVTVWGYGSINCLICKPCRIVLPVERSNSYGDF